MKIRATTTGVYAPAGFFSLREGDEYDVVDAVGRQLVGAGVADAVDGEPVAPTAMPDGGAPDQGSEAQAPESESKPAKPGKPAAQSKRVSGAPENK